MRPGCVVMAAGNASRFGENKLLALWRGRSLIERALAAVPAEELAAVVVVTQYEAVAGMAAERGFRVVINHEPQLGQSHTIRLGLQALPECGGALFMVADQPLLRRETVAELVRFWRQEPNSIAALSHGGQRGNPCLFPAELFPELLALEGERGGSGVIRRHGERLRLLETNAQQLRDVDTQQALEELREG